MAIRHNAPTPSQGVGDRVFEYSFERKDFRTEEDPYPNSTTYRNKPLIKENANYEDQDAERIREATDNIRARNDRTQERIEKLQKDVEDVETRSTFSANGAFKRSSGWDTVCKICYWTGGVAAVVLAGAYLLDKFGPAAEATVDTNA